MFKTFKTLWQLNQKQHHNLYMALLCSFIRSISGLLQFIALMITMSLLLSTISFQQAMMKVIIVTILCVILNYIASYFEQMYSISASMYMSSDQRMDIAKHLKQAPLGYFSNTSTEAITTTLTSTLTNVETGATMSLVNIISGLFNAMAMFLFLLWFDWRIGMLMGLGILAYLLVVKKQMKLSRHYAPMRQQAQDHLSIATLTFLQGIKVIKAFCYPQGDQQLKKAINDSRDANINLTTISMPSQCMAHGCIAIFESCLLLATIYFTVVTKEFDITKAILLLIMSFFAYSALNQAGSMLSMIGMLENGIEEVNKIKQAQILSTNQPIQTPNNEEIKVDHVSFSFGDHEVLHDITTTFKPHTLTAIIGPSGSGKTTLCRLLARYHEIETGNITIGNANIKHIPYETLMDQISIVFQNVYLFEDTILNNIRFAKPDATLEEVKKAAQLARCDDFINKLPDGYNTMIQEGGNSLSGGEKQRISIARAILKDSNIIILDEATSALDAENETAFFNAIDELIKNKTVIMIAHRLSSIQHADHIIAIQDGHIVQEGSPQVLKEQDGLYHDFIHSRKQAKGWQI